ncbi:MAG: FdtA/QdtA family cupin domain-containing protein [Eubacterium sp.]|nr:FdtA/QdtA family cupin domain-containing protein [Eubacterium sp.]
MNIEDRYKILSFPDLGDERGNLVVVEGGMQIPFDIKRIFYIYGSDDTVVRGQHANLRSEFVLINVAGTSKVKVDDGKETRVIELNQPRMGVYLSKMLWKEMYDFSADSVLLVLSNEHYDAGEYVREYDEYLRLLGH